MVLDEKHNDVEVITSGLVSEHDNISMNMY